MYGFGKLRRFWRLGFQAMEVQSKHVEFGTDCIMQVLGNAAALIFLSLEVAVEQLFAVFKLLRICFLPLGLLVLLVLHLMFLW